MTWHRWPWLISPHHLWCTEMDSLTHHLAWNSNYYCSWQEMGRNSPLLFLEFVCVNSKCHGNRTLTGRWRTETYGDMEYNLENEGPWKGFFIWLIWIGSYCWHDVCMLLNTKTRLLRWGNRLVSWCPLLFYKWLEMLIKIRVEETGQLVKCLHKNFSLTPRTLFFKNRWLLFIILKEIS